MGGWHINSTSALVTCVGGPLILTHVTRDSPCVLSHTHHTHYKCSWIAHMCYRCGAVAFHRPCIVTDIVDNDSTHLLSPHDSSCTNGWG